MKPNRQAILLGAGAVCLFTAAASLSDHVTFARARTQTSVMAAVYQPTKTPRARHIVHTSHHHRRRPFQNPYTYTVKPADTLWEIAHVSGVSVFALKHENRLKSNTIDIGQHLVVPQKWRVFMDKANKKAAPTRVTLGNANQVSLQQRRILFKTSFMSNAPARLLPLYEAAGARFGIPWTVLAAIHETETDFGVTNCPTSQSGAEGPMQFLPSTFASYAVKAPGQAGPPNIQNVGDAIYTAAHMLAEDGYAANPTSAIFAYNRSKAYVNHIESIAGLK